MKCFYEEETVARLPTPGADQGNWGEILNSYLLVSHHKDGRIKAKTTPSDPEDVTTKGYVDDQIDSVSTNLGLGLNAKLDTTGGTVAGDLVIGAPGTTQPHTIALTSSNVGGLNNFDSTSRLMLQSYQKAQYSNNTQTNVGQAHYGEVMRIDLEHKQAKGAIAFREHYLGGATPRTVAWLVAHGEANDSTPEAPVWHNHLSVEIPDEDGLLQTCMEFPFGAYNQPNAFGLPTSSQYARSVRNLLAAGQGLTVENVAGTDRNIHFSSTQYGDITGRRWSIMTDSTAETGTSLGSDFRINRRSDAGVFIETSLFIKRSTGQIGVGNVTAPTARLDVAASGVQYHTVHAQQTSGASTTYAAYATSLGLSTNRVMDARVIGDNTARLVILGSGQVEWGPGGSVARDTTLYRRAVKNLATDVDFEVTNTLYGVILKSPNGTRYRLKVSNTGALTTEAA